MFKETDRQAPLFGVDSQMTDKQREKLSDTWASTFARDIFPILLDVEADFADLYDDRMGRPAKSIARRLGICVLQHMFDLDDQRALDMLLYDSRWQYALGYAADEDPYLSRRSLLDFRARLVDIDPQMTRIEALFVRVRDEAMEALEVDPSVQRIDSTLIKSNIREQGRVGLVAMTLRHFLDELRKQRDDALDQLPKELVKWAQAADERGWFTAPKNKSERRKRLVVLGGWLAEVISAFAADKEINSWESFTCVARVLEEHFETADEPDPEPPSGGIESDTVTKEAKATSSSQNNDLASSPPPKSEELDSAKGMTSKSSAENPSTQTKPRLRNHAVSQREDGTTLQSPYDPDAAKGHKGVGYMVHVSETCKNEDKPEIVITYHIETANQADQNKSQILIDDQKSQGVGLTRMYADQGYMTPTAIEAANDEGVDLYGPTTITTYDREEVLGRDDFEWSEDGKIESCPAGHQPIDHRMRTWDDKEKYLYAFFDADTCDSCPFQEHCVTRRKGGQSYLTLVPKLRKRDELVASQRHKEWWDDYQIRSGVEATISELKRAHGMRKLRVRRMPKVKMAVGLKMTACNVKRWVKSA